MPTVSSSTADMLFAYSQVMSTALMTIDPTQPTAEVTITVQVDFAASETFTAWEFLMPFVPPGGQTHLGQLTWDSGSGVDITVVSADSLSLTGIAYSLTGENTTASPVSLNFYVPFYISGLAPTFHIA